METSMVRIVSLSLVVALGVVSAAALAAGDPTTTRQTVMKSVGASAKIVGGTLKGERAYDADATMLALATMRAAAHTFGDYFPDSAGPGDNTEASPKIWEDRTGFMNKLSDFQSATDAAVAAKPADLDAFKAAAGPVMQNCKSCHEGYRIMKK